MRAGTQGKIHGGMVFTGSFCGLLSAPCSANFPIQPRPTCLGMVPTIVNCGLPRQSSVKTVFGRHVIGQSDLEDPSVEIPTVDKAVTS